MPQLGPREQPMQSITFRPRISEIPPPPMSVTSRSSSAASVRAARVSTPAPAHQRVGSWELLGLIDEGRLAAVYRARPIGGGNLPGSHALKLLRPEWQEDPQALATLAREAHVGRKVAHPHLLPILAAQLEVIPNYLVMPLLPGQSLARHLRSAEQLQLPVAFWIARQVAEALEAMQRAGWMHSDVKPQNIVVSPGGHATLIDLGFARRADETRSLADRPVVGTVRYLAPEVLYSALGGDILSDVYSLGVTLFEMLTGRLPFDADDVAELAAQHRQELPSDLRSLVPHVPKRAARLVHQMLAKEPLRRPQPGELVARLAALEIETFGDRGAAE